jgi:hypothetical protein
VCQAKKGKKMFKITTVDALAIVLELAQQNIAPDEKDMRDIRIKQEAAIARVDLLLRVLKVGL